MGRNKKSEYQYRLIDGNWAWHPCAYCWRYKACLTPKLMQTHKCVEKGCKRLDMDVTFE